MNNQGNNQGASMSVLGHKMELGHDFTVEFKNNKQDMIITGNNGNKFYILRNNIVNPDVKNLMQIQEREFEYYIFMHFVGQGNYARYFTCNKEFLDKAIDLFENHNAFKNKII